MDNKSQTDLIYQNVAFKVGWIWIINKKLLKMFKQMMYRFKAQYSGIQRHKTQFHNAEA